MVVQPDFDSQFIVQIISTERIIRSKNLEAKLTEFGLNFRISPGVVPNEIEFHDGSLHSPFLSKLLCQRELSIGEVGCAIAHRNTINNFLNSDRKFGFIFEDDAEVIADFNFDVVVKLLDSNQPVIIALGWIPGFAIAKSSQFHLSEDTIELATAPTCAFAYAINRPAAKLMLTGHEKIVDLADWPIFTLNKVRFYATRSPWVTANHDPKFSIIGLRSAPVSKSPARVLVSRIRLGTYLVTLMILSKAKILDVSPKQIVHQLLIRGLLHRHGVSQVTEKLTKNEVIPLPAKFRKLLTLLKVN